MEYSIPKTIHYCWFGGKELPESARRCIESWKKYCPGYEIKEWNEKNYHIDACRYTRGAYEAKKWAFLSDYARFDILYRYGGLYFDTDVELVRPIDDILEDGPFMGMEKSTEANGKTVVIAINPGLGMGSDKGNSLVREVLDDYEKDSFESKGIHRTVVTRVTEICSQMGWQPSEEKQKIGDVTIYPPEYFGPLDNMTGKLNLTDNTRSIHNYDATWMNRSGKISIGISRKFSRTGKMGHTVGVILSIPFRVVNKLHR